MKWLGIVFTAGGMATRNQPGAMIAWKDLA